MPSGRMLQKLQTRRTFMFSRRMNGSPVKLLFIRPGRAAASSFPPFAPILAWTPRPRAGELAVCGPSPAASIRELPHGLTY